MADLQSGAGFAAANPRNRILLVTRDFFPLISDVSQRLLEWASRLQNSGTPVDILTYARHRSWPSQIRIGEVTVYRVPTKSLNPLRLRSQLREHCQWLVTHQLNYHLIYFEQPFEDAVEYLSRGVNKKSPPVWVRLDSSSINGGDRNNGFQQTLAKTTWTALAHADRLLAPSAEVEQSIIAAGLDARRIERILDTPQTVIDRSIGARRMARQILGEASHDLFLKHTSKLILIPSDMTLEWQLDIAIRALGPLCEQSPNLKVWILGDGPARNNLYRQLKHQGWHYSIFLPGIITDVQEVLQCADLCILSGINVGLTWWAITCIRNRIPLLVAQSPHGLRVLGEPSNQNTFLPSNTASLRKSVNSWLREPGPLEQATTRLQDSLLRVQPQIPDPVSLMLSSRNKTKE